MRSTSSLSPGGITTTAFPLIASLCPPAVAVAAASGDVKSTMYSSGWPLRVSVSPAATSENTTHSVWLRTCHDFVPAAETSSGARSPNSKYCGGYAPPAGRSAVRVPPSCDLGSLVS